MIAESIILDNFRNHSRTEIRGFAPLLNIIIGQNGAGKTSIIEALLVSSLTKSFIASSDASLIKTGEKSFQVTSGFVSDLRVGVHCTVEYRLGPKARKTIVVNNDKLRSSAELIGRIPIIAMTPDDKIITSGSPDERRRFMNLCLAQASRKYLEDEIEFRKTLKHRNSLLSDAVKRHIPSATVKQMLIPWTELLIKFSVPVMKRRAEFIEEFRPYLLESFQTLSGGKEQPSFRYAPINLSEWDGSMDFEALMRKQLAHRESEEIRRGTTLVGAHRDDLLILIDPQRDAKSFASHGQHKSLVASMKLAEFNFLKEAIGETPILLLDDVFSELDDKRASQLLEMISGGEFGQTFITSTTRESFEEIDFLGDKNAMFNVGDGIVKKVNSR